MTIAVPKVGKFLSLLLCRTHWNKLTVRKTFFIMKKFKDVLSDQETAGTNEKSGRGEAMRRFNSGSPTLSRWTQFILECLLFYCYYGEKNLWFLRGKKLHCMQLCYQLNYSVLNMEKIIKNQDECSLFTVQYSMDFRIQS